VVPRAVAEPVLAAALAKACAENRFRDAVKAGMPLTEAYARFKVL
jgi:hypothetical protein